MTDFNAFPKYVAIVGSRNFPHKHWVDAFVDRLQPDTVVISGGAKGVDTWAEKAARKRGLNVKIFPVEAWEWDIIGKRAGMIRNNTLLEYVQQLKGSVVAFAAMDPQGNISKGTNQIIYAAESAHIPVTIFDAFDLSQVEKV
jgi:hypothetical protein